ncbi:unnamed protein product [Ranitomeya imitator]|uniref:Uncharacterized protein n=1 Tax=Ranitomeya imitator TaxID=111125 RepID=A0ABN9M9H7_9NEOB|nr:unnamed protein product [Ranitomeya imitator]
MESLEAPCFNWVSNWSSQTIIDLAVQVDATAGFKEPAAISQVPFRKVSTFLSRGSLSVPISSNGREDRFATLAIAASSFGAFSQLPTAGSSKGYRRFYAGGPKTKPLFGITHLFLPQVTFGQSLILGLTYTFSGITLSPKPWLPVLDLILRMVMIILVITGMDEKELLPQSPIASVSFGACRDFIFKHKDSRSKHSVRKIEPVEAGSWSMAACL